MAKNIWDHKNLNNIEIIDNRSNTKGPIWYNNKGVKVWQLAGANTIYVAKPIKGVTIYYNFNNFDQLLNQEAFNNSGFSNNQLYIEIDLTEINLLSFKCINKATATGGNEAIYINSMIEDSGISTIILGDIKSGLEIKDKILNYEKDYPIKRMRFIYYSLPISVININFYIEIQDKISQEIKSKIVEQLTIIKDKYLITF